MSKVNQPTTAQSLGALYESMLREMRDAAGDSGEFKLTDIGERDRVDVILTNPPFGGEEEKGIQGNFPEDKQTAETALLFLQLIMRKLRKVRSPGFSRPGATEADRLKAGLQTARAAVVVPNGTLFGDGVCARIKEELHQNRAHPVRGIRAVGRVVEQARRKRARLESLRRRTSGQGL